jgi:hypothetical protein
MAQPIAAHERPKTTKLYDRTNLVAILDVLLLRTNGFAALSVVKDWSSL